MEHVQSYSNPEVDELLEATRATADQEERAGSSRKSRRSCRLTSPYAFLHHTTDITGF